MSVNNVWSKPISESNRKPHYSSNKETTVIGLKQISPTFTKMHTTTHRIILPLLCASLAAGFAPAALGQVGPVYYIDVNGSAPGFGDPTGTITDTETDWTMDLTGVPQQRPCRPGTLVNIIRCSWTLAIQGPRASKTTRFRLIRCIQ